MYIYIHNNYYSTEVLDAAFFKKEADSLSKKHGRLKQHVEIIEQKFKTILALKKEYIHALKLNKNEISLIELLEFFAWYQDYRKEYAMRSLHYIDVLLKEIGSRSNLTLVQMKCSMRSEIPAILNRSFDIRLLDIRLKEFLAVWDFEKNQFSTYTKDAREVWKKIDPHIVHAEEHFEISGQPASSGIARGLARVTMSANDARDLQVGEILVTSMTTPDFITAMKKAKAIVTNEGGILCHAAVISREFGIPCVIGTKIATKVIQTGDLIEVNAILGIVKKV